MFCAQVEIYVIYIVIQTFIAIGLLGMEFNWTYILSPLITISVVYVLCKYKYYTIANTFIGTVIVFGGILDLLLLVFPNFLNRIKQKIQSIQMSKHLLHIQMLRPRPLPSSPPAPHVDSKMKHEPPSPLPLPAPSPDPSPRAPAPPITPTIPAGKTTTVPLNIGTNKTYVVRLVPTNVGTTNPAITGHSGKSLPVTNKKPIGQLDFQSTDLADNQQPLGMGMSVALADN